MEPRAPSRKRTRVDSSDTLNIVSLDTNATSREGEKKGQEEIVFVGEEWEFRELEREFGELEAEVLLFQQGFEKLERQEEEIEKELSELEEMVHRLVRYHPRGGIELRCTSMGACYINSNQFP